MIFIYCHTYHTHTHTRVHTHTHTHSDTHMHAHTHTHTHTHTHSLSHTHTHTHTQVHPSSLSHPVTYQHLPAKMSHFNVRQLDLLHPHTPGQGSDGRYHHHPWTLELLYTYSVCRLMMQVCISAPLGALEELLMLKPPLLCWVS